MSDDARVAELRKLFPVVEHWTYLFNGSIHPCPRPVGEAMRSFLEAWQNGGEAAWPPAYEAFERLKEKFADLIHTKAGRDFTLTVGMVSNHGNWFTSDDHNKELKVLAQSYDWLLFLTDTGLSAFVESLLIKPARGYRAIKEAFVQSYRGKKGGNKGIHRALTADGVYLMQDISGSSHIHKDIAVPLSSFASFVFRRRCRQLRPWIEERHVSGRRQRTSSRWGMPGASRQE